MKSEGAPLRHATRIDYAERIDRVVSYLESASLCEGSLPLDVLAGVAAFSPHHFHRVYRLMTGEAIGDTIRRIRLARTLPDLGRKDVSVTNAAAASGYGSSQAYARAIRRIAGISATRVRRSDQSVAELAAMLCRGPSSNAALSVEIVSTEPFRVAAIRNVGAYAELDKAYERLFSLVFAELPFDRLVGIFGIPYEDPRFGGDGSIRFDCAIDVGATTSLPPGVETLAISGGAHLRLRHVGSYDGIFDAMDLVYATALAGGMSLTDEPLHIHYLDTPEEKPEDQLRSDIFLPISL